MDWQAMADACSKGAEVLRESLPEDLWPSPTSTAFGAAAGIVIGLVLALWGAKLLRFLFVAAFIFAGAYGGIRLARSFAIDDLFGLVVGAAIVGLLGHFLFRWWVGITTGLCAMIIAAAVLGPRILPQLPEDLNAFWDEQQGVGTGSYSDVLQRRDDPDAATAQKDLLKVLDDLRVFIWARHPQEARKLSLMLALAWFVGAVLGAIAPRTTTICITSFLGIGIFAVNIAYLLATRWPGAWASVSARSGWCLGALGLALVISLAWQFRSRRPIVAKADTAPAS
jgi:hypothetical protein